MLWESWTLGIEAWAVIGLRMSVLATGDRRAQAEATRMVAEKIDAAAQLQWRALTGRLGADPLAGARQSIAHYRRAIRKNRRRLARRS